MANARGKHIDGTHLSADAAEERVIIHRDLIAHVFRWTHVAKYVAANMRYKKAKVLDAGCGVDLPLARMMYSNRFIALDYAGVDYNKSDKFKLDMFKSGKFPMSAYGGVDFASKQVLVRSPEFDSKEDHVVYIDGDKEEGEHDLPNIITSFEVIEHVEPSHARAMLRKIGVIMRHAKEAGETPVAFISTPCYDQHTGAADNHVNEMTYLALGGLIEDLGFEIEAHYGTFASIKDYKDKMLESNPEVRWLWEKLRGYYDSNVLATIFAPVFPQHARNVLWTLRIAPQSYSRKFAPLIEAPKPWSSSELWEQLASDDHYRMEV
jgi:hypothetical protein